MQPGARPNGVSAGHSRQSYVKSVQSFRQPFATLSFSAYNGTRCAMVCGRLIRFPCARSATMRTGTGKGAIAGQHVLQAGNAQAGAGRFFSGGSSGFVDLPRGRRGSYLRCIVCYRILYVVRARVWSRASLWSSVYV